MSEAIRIGAGPTVVALLIETHQQKVIDRRLGAVNDLIKSIIGEIEDAQKAALAEWLSPLVQKHPTRLAVSYFLLAENDRETAKSVSKTKLVFRSNTLKDSVERLRQIFERLICRVREPFIFDLAPENLDQIQLWAI